MIKLIIFDFDDTLVDSKKAHFHIDNLAAKKLGFKPAIKKIYHATYCQLYEDFIQKMYPGISIAKFREAQNEIFDVKQFKLFPNTKEVLDYLSQKYTLAILSAKENGKLRPTLEHLKISKYFSYIHGKEDSPHFKPDPKVFDKILHHFRLKKDEVAYVGDLDVDRSAAESAGIFFVGINDCPKEGFLWCDSIEGLKKIF